MCNLPSIHENSPENDALLVPVQGGRQTLFVRAALPGVKIAQKAEYIWADGREGAVDKASDRTCQLAGWHA